MEGVGFGGGAKEGGFPFRREWWFSLRQNHRKCLRARAARPAPPSRAARPGEGGGRLLRGAARERE